MLSVAISSQYHYAESRYSESCYAEFHGVCMHKNNKNRLIYKDFPATTNKLLHGCFLGTYFDVKTTYINIEIYSINRQESNIYFKSVYKFKNDNLFVE